MLHSLRYLLTMTSRCVNNDRTDIGDGHADTQPASVFVKLADRWFEAAILANW